MSGLKVEYKNIKELIPYCNNSRTHSDEQVLQIASSIKEFGFTNPVLIDNDDGIIAGHGRVLAARKLSMQEVPCLRLGYLTDTQKRAYVIADNKLALNAGWDSAALKIEFESLKAEGFDIELTGFNQGELDELFASEDDETEGLTDEDEIPEAGKQSVTKDGDIWVLGRHRLMCGDSTNSASMSLLMEGELADLVWTDPPYNVAYEGGTSEKMTIKNDSMEDSQFYQFLFDAFKALIENTKMGGCIYIAHADSEGVNFRTAMRDSGWLQKQCLIWVKNSPVLGRQDYNWKHEPILYGWKPGAAHYFGMDFTNTTVIDDDVDVSKMKRDELLKVVKELRNSTPTTIIRDDKPHRNDIHPTMKPVSLVQRMVENSSMKGEKVLDAFGGGGATMIACEKTGRKSRLMELDPKYCDVIIKRWQNFTGKQATLESNGKTYNELLNDNQAKNPH